MNKEVTTTMSWLINTISINNYSKDIDIRISKNEKAINEFNESMKKHLDFNNITIDDAKNLRFIQRGNLWLIPLYLLPILPDGLELTRIDGSKVIVGKDYIDNDIRYGCIAYGIEIKE